MTSQIPLAFDILCQFREHEGEQVLETLVGLAGVPLVRGYSKIEHPNDPEFVQILAGQEVGRIAREFALDLRHALTIADETRPRERAKLSDATDAGLDTEDEAA